jgi:acetyltransferase-like isoleucine patch superfamily enzyme
VKLTKNCKIGKNTIIREPVNLYKCKIGDNCKIGGFVYIEEGVKIGDNCKIKPFVFIPTGVIIENGVFIGPGVTFTNDKYPRAINPDGSLKGDEDWQLVETLIKKGASIGAGATIMCGITIGEYAVIGAGAVVTKDVPARYVVAENPAKITKENVEW